MIKSIFKVFCLLIFLLILLIAVSDKDNNKDPTKSKPPPKPREIVFNHPWDGSVKQIENFHKNNLNDPNSVEYMEWSPVIKVKDGFLVRVKYRAKNIFGGYVIKNQKFFLDKNGRIISYVDIN